MAEAAAAAVEEEEEEEYLRGELDSISVWESGSCLPCSHTPRVRLILPARSLSRGLARAGATRQRVGLTS